MKVPDTLVAGLIAVCTFRDKCIGQLDAQGKFKTIFRSMLRLFIRPNCNVAALMVKELSFSMFCM